MKTRSRPSINSPRQSHTLSMDANNGDQLILYKAKEIDLDIDLDLVGCHSCLALVVLMGQDLDRLYKDLDLDLELNDFKKNAFLVAETERRCLKQSEIRSRSRSFKDIVDLLIF